MADTTKFDVSSRKLLVHRIPRFGTNQPIDEYEDNDLSFAIHDNGTLIVKASLIAVASYPAGTWERVTPDTAK